MQQTTGRETVVHGEEGLDVDLSRLVATALASWKPIVIAAVLGGLIAAGLALQLRNVYRAQALLAPVTPSAGAIGGGQFEGLGGLAALAGFDIRQAGGRREEFVAMLRSAGFARDFIEAEQLMPVLFEERWNSAMKTWNTGEDAPTLQDGVRYFHSKVVSVIDDSRTRLITVSIDWYSPDLAARWANRIVEIANERARSNAIRDAERSIEYLNEELGRAGVVELQQAIYRLIETQVNNAMLANVQREYAFRVLDAAVPSDLKHKVGPNRSLISISGALGSGLLTLIAVLWLRRRQWVS